MTSIDPVKIEAEILQEIISQTRAHREFEIFIGSDNIARINSDGVCILRVHLDPGCEVSLVNLDREVTLIMHIDDQP
jgi:hypothetical protein